MKTLSNDDLDHVTGGKDLSTVAGTGGGGGSNDAMLTTLQGIQSSLKDLGKNQNQGLFGGQSGMLFMTMALAMSQNRGPSQTVVYGGGGCCRRRGFSFSW
jgi:bacteriocin-like protein